MMTPPAQVRLLTLLLALAACPMHAAETADAPTPSVAEQAKAVGRTVKQDAKAVGKAVQEEAKKVGKAAKEQAKVLKAKVKEHTSKAGQTKPEKSRRDQAGAVDSGN